MDLSFPVKAQLFGSNICYKSPSYSTSVKLYHKVSRPQFSVHGIRVRSEFDHKVNGAFSPDYDARFLDRQKALEAAMNDINSSFGKGSVTRLGSAGGALVETFPSGCLTLDFALGGGLPKGRIVEIYGPESSGKTTLALHAIAEVQKLGGNAMLVDAEHAFDPAYSKALGVDVENLIVCQPDNGEMALEIADRMCRSGAIDLICIDSVSALTPRAEIEGEIGMQQMGLQARLMSQALRKMSGNASKAGCTLIFLNQIRYKIGVYYGNPEVTSGGIALKFFASVRLEIRSTGKIKSAKGDEEVGLKVRVRVQKSKVSRPYKQAEFEIIFGEGVSKLGCVLDCAELIDVVSKKGSWYNYGEHRKLIYTEIAHTCKVSKTNVFSGRSGLRITRRKICLLEESHEMFILLLAESISRVRRIVVSASSNQVSCRRIPDLNTCSRPLGLSKLESAGNPWSLYHLPILCPGFLQYLQVTGEVDLLDSKFTL